MAQVGDAAWIGQCLIGVARGDRDALGELVGWAIDPIEAGARSAIPGARRRADLAALADGHVVRFLEVKLMGRDLEGDAAGAGARRQQTFLEALAGAANPGAFVRASARRFAISEHRKRDAADVTRRTALDVGDAIDLADDDEDVETSLLRAAELEDLRHRLALLRPPDLTTLWAYYAFGLLGPPARDWLADHRQITVDQVDADCRPRVARCAAQRERRHTHVDRLAERFRTRGLRLERAAGVLERRGVPRPDRALDALAGGEVERLLQSQQAQRAASNDTLQALFATLEARLGEAAARLGRVRVAAADPDPRPPEWAELAVILGRLTVDADETTRKTRENSMMRAVNRLKARLERTS